MTHKFELGVQPPMEPGDSRYFIYSRGNILSVEGESLPGHHTPNQLKAINQYYLGLWQGQACFAVEVEDDSEMLPAGCEWVNLRSLLTVIDEETFAVAGRGLQLIGWHKTHRYCGRCGAATEEHPQERVPYCQACECTFYPRISPCVIVLVTRGEQLLLAQGTRHVAGTYSTLAGFVEAGETLEQAVHREIKEEVDIAVDNLRYIASQAWPFPHQLMLGFHVDYKFGELNPDRREILDAQWWHYRELPTHPPPQTIAGRLIAQYVEALSKGD